MLISNRGHAFAAVVSAAFVLTACSGSDGGTLSTDETGFLSLAVSDGPVHSARKVCITFDAIELKRAADAAPEVIPLSPAVKVDLLSVQGTNAAPLLIDQELTAGGYEWLRLAVDADLGSNGGAGDTGGDACDGEASYLVRDDGGVYNLFVPSGAQTGLKLVSPFTVPANGSADFTVEFDLMKSVIAPPGLAPDMILKPALRLMDNILAGTLTGLVDEGLATAAGCTPSVYLFDDNVTPNRIDDVDPPDPNDPVATAIVEERMAGSGLFEYPYTIGFLGPGDYVAAFTCDGATFTPVDGVPVTIAASQVTTQDF